jgi:NADH:ubiquinone oxidoreductase subunit F (NADH-binding)
MTLVADQQAPVGVRRLTAPDLDIGPLPRLHLDELIAVVEEAGLTGRGGAGFPTARKLHALRTAGRAPVVVGNAMEGEHLSRKDALLLESAPRLLVDGLDILGDALGARRRILAVGPGKDSRAVRAAVSRGSRTEVLDLLGGFVSGQESALVRRLDGRPGVPADTLVPVYVTGVGGRPTLVVNAETLAQLALLARFGAAWFRSQGTPEDPGTFLATLTGSSPRVVPHPGVVELARGTPLRDALSAGSVPVHEVGAVLVGGYHGAWLPSTAIDVPLSRGGLAPFGASPGAGVLHVLDRAHCPLVASASIAGYLAQESAGQCGPCVNGLPRMADTLTRLAGLHADRRLVTEVERLRALVTGRGACAHPDGTARFVASTMRTFGPHVDAHLAGLCPANEVGHG